MSSYVGVVELTLPAASASAGVAGTMGVVPTNKHAAGEGQTLLYSTKEKFDGKSRLVIALHGHGADSSTFNHNLGPGRTALALVRTGRYIVLSIDAGGGAAWGNPTAQARITDAVTWARANGARAGKYGLLGWSMGGLTSLTRILADAANVAGAWLWVPALDLRYFNSTAGYNAPGATGVANNAAYTTELAAAYPSGFAASDPMQNIAGFKAISQPVPTVLALASDDTVVPPPHADYWLAQVNNPSFFAHPKGKVLGGHTMLFGNFTDDEFVGHYDKLPW